MPLADPPPRHPADVPDRAADVRAGHDTDGDGRADTLLTVDGPDLLVHTDLDGDGLADRILRIGPDGAVDPVAPDPEPAPGDPVLDALWGGVAAGTG